VSYSSLILRFDAYPWVDSVGIVEIALKPRPSLVQNFVGRRDILDAMHRTHATSRSADLTTPAITVLSGLGGSGKTQTALKFALEFETRCALESQSETNAKCIQVPRGTRLFSRC
jgi:Holliday junction resolvasome RuvABC ATP-dependent DNA helicase subunit